MSFAAGGGMVLRQHPAPHAARRVGRVRQQSPIMEKLGERSHAPLTFKSLALKAKKVSANAAQHGVLAAATNSFFMFTRFSIKVKTYVVCYIRGNICNGDTNDFVSCFFIFI